jgi:SAM-dependent methyltransferase
MTESIPQAAIDAARAYDALFVPALFAQWAPVLIRAANLQRGQRVLDVACGTGALTREVARHTGSNGRVVGLDATAGMIAVAAQLEPSIEWTHGVAESLPFPDRSFDAVVSQFGFMFFADRRQAVREMLRVLDAGGHIAVAVWDALDSMPAYATEVALLEQSAGRAAADALRAPFVLGNRDDLVATFAAAGAVSIDVATHHGTARFPNIRTMVEADLRGWLPVMGVSLSEAEIGSILRQADDTLSAYAGADATATFDLSAHVVTARKP